MYVRLRKNASGSTSVFIVDSRRLEGGTHSKSIMVKSFGSSFDKEKIELLKKEAEEYKEMLVKLGIDNTKTLTIASSLDVSSCKVEASGIRELYGSIFNRFFCSLHLKKVNLPMLADIALMRIAKPMSKLRTANEASNFGIDDLTPNKIYKFMDSLNDQNIDKLKKAIYKNTKQILGEKEEVDLLFYDLTTIAFETNAQDDLRDFGFSKDGKSQHVQITLVLIVTRHGAPIGYEIFPGNVYEGHTLIPVMQKLKKDYKIDKICIVADSALMNKVNLSDLEANGFYYIIAARVRNLEAKVTKEMLSAISYIHKENSDLKYKVIEQNNGQNLITVFSGTRAKKDAYERAKIIAKADKHLGKSANGRLKSPLKKAYFTLSESSNIILDEKKLEQDKSFDGYFGFYTNLTTAHPEEIIAQYKGLWQVEQSFRITKHNLKIRPVYHWHERRIKAHFAICFLALSLVRYTEILLKKANQHIPIEQLHASLEKVQRVYITSSKGEIFKLRTDIPKELLPVYHALSIKPEARFLAM